MLVNGSRGHALGVDRTGARVLQHLRMVCCGSRSNYSESTRREKECDMEVTTRKPQEMYGVVSASKIIGEEVVNRQNESLGKIHELVIDAQDGRLAYAVLTFGGFMGMGTKLFAMPWKAFEFSNTENKLILNVDKKKLEHAPGFEKDAVWPDFADR